MPKYMAKTSIPLLCSLCPKAPTFSDISHLLTHISSKGHLAHRFKLEIRGQSEQEARQQLDVFNHWYAENGIEDLLAERLAAKEFRKPSRRNRKSSSKAAQSDKVKDEHNGEDSLDRTPVYKSRPRLHLWPTGSSVATVTTANSAGSIDPFIQNDIYDTPSLIRQVPNFAPPQTPTLKRVPPLRLSPGKSDETEDEFDLDNSQLKGVIWPGMSRFDSATTPMRRKRNQKKDGTVLAQMKINSADVEPTELVFQYDGEFIKARDIYAPPSDYSPGRTEEAVSPKMPSPKISTPKRKRRKASKVENGTIQLSMHSLREKAATPQERVNRNKHVRDRMKRPFEIASDNGAKQTTYKSSKEEDEEFNLTMDGMRKSNHAGIFRDSDHNFGRSGSPIKQHKSNISNASVLQPSDTNTATHRSVYPPLKHSHMSADKENIPPHDLYHLETLGGYPQFFNDSFFQHNPLYYPHNGLPNQYNEHVSFDSDARNNSTFQGDVKPMTMDSYDRRPAGLYLKGLSYEDDEDVVFGGI